MSRICDRCGQAQNVENHHINYRVYGGTDDKENLISLCRGCHDYRHAKEQVLRAIESHEKRLNVLKNRLEMIESLNTPELVNKKGYQPYFETYRESLTPLKGCRTE